MSIDWIDTRWKEKEYFIQSSYKYQLGYWEHCRREFVRDELSRIIRREAKREEKEHGKNS